MKLLIKQINCLCNYPCKYLGLLLVSLLLLACSDHNKAITAADLQGRYQFQMSFTDEEQRLRQGSAVKDREILFTIGPDYIAFGHDKQAVERMWVQELAGEKYLVLSVHDKEMRLHILNKETLVLSNGQARGTFSRVK